MPRNDMSRTNRRTNSRHNHHHHNNNNNKKDDLPLDACRNCHGMHKGMICPKTYKLVDVCSNCSNGRHIAEHCTRPIRILSKAGNDYYKPFVYGNDSMYEQVPDKKAAPAPPRPTTTMMRPGQVPPILILETYKLFDSKGKVISGYQKVEKIDVPKNTNEILIVDLDD